MQEKRCNQQLTMRLFLIISLLFVYTVVPAKEKIKSDSVSLVTAMTQLNIALVQKDSVTLGKLLHKRLHYGHSNGWIESKKEVINDLYNGKLVYNKIEASGYEIEIVREVATVRSKTDIDVLLDGKPVAITLHVLQVWIWKDKEGWKLLSRQSVKM